MQVSQATFLYRLQTLDLTIVQRRARLKEIETALANNEQVAQAQRQLDAADQSLKPWQIRARDLDLEIKSLLQKIKETDERLYSGKVRNPKELQDLQSDIVSLKRRQSQLEDELLQAMLNSDEGQAAVAEAQKGLNQVKAIWAGAQHDLTDEKGRIERELTGLESQRKQAATAVDADTLKKYETLRAKKQGHAVALLVGDSCKTCGVEQTSMLAQQVRQGTQLVYCNNCGRILATP